MRPRFGGDASLGQRRQEIRAIRFQKVDPQPQRRRASEPKPQIQASRPTETLVPAPCQPARQSEGNREIFYRMFGRRRKHSLAQAAIASLFQR